VVAKGCGCCLLQCITSRWACVCVYLVRCTGYTQELAIRHMQLCMHTSVHGRGEYTGLQTGDMWDVRIGGKLAGNASHNAAGM